MTFIVLNHLQKVVTMKAVANLEKRLYNRKLSRIDYISNSTIVESLICPLLNYHILAGYNTNNFLLSQPVDCGKRHFRTDPHRVIFQEERNGNEAEILNSLIDAIFVNDFRQILDRREREDSAWR